jgi:hypothetical protein
MTIDYTNFFFIPRPSKIYPNLDFGFENIPSGNPDAAAETSNPTFSVVLTVFVRKTLSLFS